MPSSKQNHSSFSLASFDAIGFDVDMTLAKNNVPNILRSVHDGMTKFLVEKKGYDKDLLEPFDKHHDFCTRSIIFDCRKGNFLKLGQDGTILRASHGTKFLSHEEIRTEYDDGRQQDVAMKLINDWENITASYIVFDNFYDMIGNVVMARMVDLADRKKGKRLDDYLFVWSDILAAYHDTYHFSANYENRGGYFPPIKENREKFLYPCSEKVKKWLLSLKQEGIVLFFMTSAYIDFGMLNINYLFGSDWQKYFDIGITHAKKPGFFFAGRPFIHLDDKNMQKKVENLETGHIYLEGNADTLTEYIRRRTGKTDPNVLYVGDSIRSDMYPPKRHTNWRTAMVLEEMEAETPALYGTTDSADDQDISERDLYLTSRLWGSILTDDTDTTPSGDKINTLFGHLVCKYSDIAVPSVDALAELQLDQEIGTFDNESFTRMGFYPGKPTALQK